MTSAAPRLSADDNPGPSDFRRLAEGRYVLRFDYSGVELHVDRLRRRSDELIGELTVRADLGSALTTVDGVLASSDFNFSSMVSRERHAGTLARRARTGSRLDWPAVLERCCQLVLQAEREGQPAVRLRDVARPELGSDLLDVHGFALPRRLPSILFGDGGSGKSYLALWLAGTLAGRGTRVGLLDWELSGPDHRDRYERLFGDAMPPELYYLRCERPLVHDVERLRRLVADLSLEFLIFDSVGFATLGAPESAEAALGYFQAVRRFGAIGTLHLAHISRSENADQKPFGSSFWHNSARVTWYCKAAEDNEPGCLAIGIFERKRNLGHRRQPFGLDITSTADRTTITRRDVLEAPDLASKVPLSSRLRTILRAGARSRADLEAAFPDEKPDTIRRVLHRLVTSERITRLPGPPGSDERFGLAHRSHS